MSDDEKLEQIRRVRERLQGTPLSEEDLKRLRFASALVRKARGGDSKASLELRERIFSDPRYETPWYDRFPDLTDEEWLKIADLALKPRNIKGFLSLLDRSENTEGSK